MSYLGFLESAYFYHILDLRPLQKEGRIVLDDKKAAITLVNAVEDAKIISPLHFGIIRHISDDATDTDLCSVIEKYLKAEWIRNTRSYQLFFESETNLLRALENPLTFSYEKHQIQDYRFLPMRCYDFQQYRHAAQTCKTLLDVFAVKMITRTKDRTLALRV